MKKCLSILLVILIGTFLCKAQETGCFKTNAHNEVVLENNIDFSKYNAFFLGEFHGVYGVSEIKLAMIKYLNQHYDITDVFMEVGYSAAYLYNAYLATGDTSLLINPTLVYNIKQPDCDFWEQLYVYNKGLQHKITIRGNDFERIEFIKVLKLLMPAGKEKPREILPVLNYIDAFSIPNIARLHSGNSYMQNSIYENIRDSIAQKRAVYKTYFGANYKIIAGIMFNENTYRNYDDRNKTMYHSMMKQVKSDGIKKFIAFNGLNHAHLSGWHSLCYRLAKTPGFKHKVADIAMVCKNCYDWQLQPAHQHTAFRAAATYYQDTTLINTIYQRYYNPDCKYTLLPTDSIDDDKVKKFSNFILLMKDQPEF